MRHHLPPRSLRATPTRERPRRASLLALLIGITLATAAPAPAAAAPPAAAPASSAAPAAPSAPPAIVPPRPLAPLGAAYPPGAEGDALVLLELVINADGTVRRARVLEGAEPFASAALAASARFSFAPATRNGAPISAAIRAEIHFIAPVVETPPEPAALPAKPGASRKPGTPAPRAPGAPGASPSPTAPTPEPVEITVRGEALAPSVSSLSRAEVRLLPGAFGDPFRAIEMLPGVTPLASGIPYFYVRGAPPGNVGYFLDGIRVPLLYHLGLGPSVVHPAIVDRVDLYPGGYPTRFGRFAGGIVSGETRPPLDVAHGEAVIRLVDAGALVEAPFADGRGSVLVGGRYSYTGAVLSLIAPAVNLGYWDYQARIAYDITPRDTVTLFAFGSHDYLSNKDESGQVSTLLDTTFHRVDLRYAHRLGTGGTLRHALTFGYDQTVLGEAAYARDLLLTSRTELTQPLAGGGLFRAGLDATYDDNRVDLSEGPGDVNFTGLFKPKYDVAASAYADAVLPITPRFEVTPGLRLDAYGEGGITALAVDPRLAARLAVTPAFRLVQAMGMASQPPSFILPGPGFHPSLDGGLQRSFQWSAGVEADLPEDVFVSAIMFQSGFFNLTDALGAIDTRRGPVPDAFDSRSRGHAIGLELTARRRLTRKLGGYFTYTLSRSTRTIGGETRASSFDRTHVANAALSYDFGRGYRAGTRLLFYTGIPSQAATAEDDKRLPPFFRLDMRLEKRWTLGKRAWLSVVLEVLNATLSKEVLSERCRRGTCTAEAIGPVTVPSLGVEGGF